jgi:type IV pilus assembly protein PilO
MANSKKILIIVALVLAVCVVYLFVFFQPKKVEISELQDTLDKKKADMQEKQRIAKDVDKFNRQVEELNERWKESMAQMPVERQIPEILRLFARMASISGIELNNFTVTPEAKKALYSEVPIELVMTGGFHNIAIFFDKISKQERIINISNVKIANPVIVNGETVITATCTATAFRSLSAAEAAPPPAPPTPAAPPPGAAPPPPEKKDKKSEALPGDEFLKDKKGKNK